MSALPSTAASSNGISAPSIPSSESRPQPQQPQQQPMMVMGTPGHPPLSPRIANPGQSSPLQLGIPHHHHRSPNGRSPYANRQTRASPVGGPLVPLSSSAAAGIGGGGGMTAMTGAAGGSSNSNNRSRSRSYGNQPLGWSPQRSGPFLSLSPAGLPGSKVLPGLPDMTLNHHSSSLSFPVVSESQRAMEAVVQKERTRAKAMEQEEANLTAEELRTVLKRERHRMARLAADLASMRSMAVQSVAEAEVHEEGRINNLMRRLDGLQQEKGRIIVELEREEEMLTNNLQRKLNEVRREKAVLEKQQMSRPELEARLAALQKGDGDIDMSEALEEKEEMEDRGE